MAARFGTRAVIAAALGLMGVTMMLTGLAQTFGFAFAMRLLTGLGNGAAFVPAMALGSAWFSVRRRGFATGIVSGGIGLGFVTLFFGIGQSIGPGLGGYLADMSQSFTLPFLVAGHKKTYQQRCLCKVFRRRSGDSQTRTQPGVTDH